MIEPDMIVLVIIIWILFFLLMVVNYKALTKYPDRLIELAFGGNIPKSKGPSWLIITKVLIFLASFLFIMFLISMPLAPSRYSYLFLGILIGVLGFNLIHDYLTYKQATKRTS